MQPWLTSAWQDIARSQAHGRPQAYCLVHPPGLSVEPLRDKLTAHLLCQSADEKPCGHCASCHQLALNTHPDLLSLIPEGAAGMIPVDSVRAAIDTAYTTAALGGNRVIQVRPSEALNRSSSHALLKIIEEPPQGTFFIFETALPGKLLPTLVSRLRMLRIPPPDAETLAAFAAGAGGDATDLTLGEVLLAEPLAAIESPERFNLATSVLSALHQVKSGEDPQKVASQFQKKDATVVLTAFSRIVMAVLHARMDARPVLGFEGPYPDAHWLFQVLDRVNDSRQQAQANIAVNMPLAMSVLLSTWAFVWTRVPR